MSRISESITVDVPVRAAYDQWTQFEEFPRFMDGVEQVVQVDDRTLAWTAKVGGQKRRWLAEITDQRPDERIAWRSIEGARNAGAVTFHALDEGTTRLDLELEIAPDGVLEQTADHLGYIGRQALGDLERFKEFIEARGSATGAWRGTIGQTSAR